MTKRRRRGPTPRREWEPLTERQATVRIDGVHVPRDLPEGTTVWGNDRYTVTRRELEGGGLQLSIHDHQRTARHDWRDFQRIKNEVAGPEREAVELYPRESRLTDTANEYHLWVAPEGTEIPIGWDGGRVVADGSDELPPDVLAEAARQAGVDPEQTAKALGNARQRPVPRDWREREETTR